MSMPRITFTASWRGLTQAARRRGRGLILAASAPLGRIALLCVFLLALVWLLYGAVWRPITAPAPLPPLVDETDPRLDTERLREVALRRAAREAAAPLAQDRAAAVFLLPSPSPTPRP